ncbi:MAG: deaminase [Candidatus Methanoperedens sp.]|nr:deaminase [Candidatus Methanoperedens sp.]
MKQQRFLALARQISKKSDHPKYKMGCVIVKGKKVLGVGFNTCKTHTKSPHKYKSMHAEFMAAINAEFDIAGSTAYIFRQQKDGTWAMAKPCGHCWAFLMSNGVKKVVYSFQGSFKQEKMVLDERDFHVR